MKLRSNLTILFSAVLLLFTSCAKETEMRSAVDMDFSARKDTPSAVKTTLSGLSLSWEQGDIVGVAVDGIQPVTPFVNESGDSFHGSFGATGRKDLSAHWYACTPYPQSADGTMVSGRLSPSQTAPFDGRCDYIVADVETGEYDEDNMPELSFTFSNHLFSIVRIDITNSDATLQGDRLSSVTLQSEYGLLAGDFSVDISGGAAARPFFHGETYNSVTVAYPSGEGPVLGNGECHTLYAVVMPMTMKGLKLTVNTDKHKGSIESSYVVSFQSGYVTELPVVDFSDIAEDKPHEHKYNCAFIGDSITDYWDNKHPAFFSDNKYLNKGVGGNSTTEMLNRFQKDVINQDPECVIILGGINDYYYKKIANDSITVDNIKKMSRMAEDAGIKVMLCSIMLTSGCDNIQPNGKTRKENIIEMNRQIKEYATAHGYPYVDYYHLLVDKDGNYVSSYFSDGVHPTLSTYYIMEDYVKPIIDAELSK